VDITLNDKIRLITRSLKPTRIDEVEILSGIVSHEIRRKTAAKIERKKQINDDRHVMYGITPTHSRLVKEIFHKNDITTKGEPHGKPD